MHAESEAKQAWAGLRGAWEQPGAGASRAAPSPASSNLHAGVASTAGPTSGGLQTLAAAAASAGQPKKPPPVKPTAKPAPQGKGKPAPPKQQRAPAGQPSLFGAKFGFTRSVEHRGQLHQLPAEQPLVGTIACSEPTCAERFDRMSAMRSHVRHRHGGLPQPPRGRVKEGAAGEERGDCSGEERDADATSEDEAAAGARLNSHTAIFSCLFSRVPF